MLAAVARLGLVMAVFGAACDDGSLSISPFPISMDLSRGPVLLGIADGDMDPETAVVDTLSPRTVIDNPVTNPRRRITDLTLHGILRSDDSAQWGYVPQVAISGADALELSPCDDGDDSQLCPLGFAEQADLPRIKTILGADALSRQAVRFAFPDERIQLFPDIAGNSQDRALLCDGVFNAPFYGGGTLVISGAEVPFNGLRIALGGCVYDDTYIESLTQGEGTNNGSNGTDQMGETSMCTLPFANPADPVSGQFLISTGFAISVVSDSFYERYAAAFADVTPLSALPEAELHLLSGPVSVRMGELRNLALTDTADDQRGPCRERYVNVYTRLLGDCDSSTTDFVDCVDQGDSNAERFPVDLACPCSGTFCTADAVVEIGRPIAVAVLDDAALLWQALRDELRPRLPEIDGIVAPNALASVEMDIDYPNNRIIFRCPNATQGSPECLIRPAVLDDDSDARRMEILEDIENVCGLTVEGILEVPPAEMPPAMLNNVTAVVRPK